MRDYVSDDHIENIGEIATGQARIIQALSLDNSQKDKEIERLKDVIKNKHLKEIERLNNILSNFEKWLDTVPNYFMDTRSNNTGVYVQKGMQQMIDMSKNKLQELKGDDNNGVKK